MPVSGNYGTPGNPNGDIWSEFWELQFYSGSDPAHVEGDFWGRSDLTSGDKIATLRFDNGTAVVDIPVFPAATDPNSSVIKKVVGVDTPNGEGWMPILDTNGYSPSYNYLGYQHGGVRHGVHDSLSAIPDSAINRWPIQEGSGTTVTDVIGSNDGTISGATWQSDSTAIEGWKLSFDNTDDSGQIANYTTNIFDGGGAFAFTVEFSTFNELEPIWSKGATFDAADGFDWYIGLSGGASNELLWRISDGSDFIVDIGYALSNLSTDTKYRVVLNWDGTTDTNAAELWVNNSTVASGTATGTNPANNQNTLYFGAEEDSATPNRYSGNDHDEAISFDSSLVDSEIANDYDRQPWS